MKILKSTLSLLLVFLTILSNAQVNPLLKKYAGSYHRMNFGEEKPTATTEKVTFTADGKWSSVGFPVNEEGVVSKVAVKKTGTWKASEGTISMEVTEKGATTEQEYVHDGEFWMSTNSYLLKIFVSNPAFVTKYAGSYQIFYYGHNDEPLENAQKVSLKTDGKCTRTTPVYDNDGKLTATPLIEPGIWKANDSVIQLTFKQDGEDETTAYTLENGTWVDRKGNSLKKVIPPPPPGLYLGKYAGTYHLIAEGQKVTSRTDKYVLKADGTGTWSYFTSADAKAVPTVAKGTWKASEGLIQLYIYPEGMGDGGHGDELITDYKLVNGVFRAENLILKKVVPSAQPKK